LPDSQAAQTQGYMAYSRVCTHAGCPVALYRAADRELICPCHQSVFNVLADGAVVSGPADHPLPRLPIEIGEDGVLRAIGDFPSTVGPGFWEESPPP
jgi:ubiquinol-cytochrome c reductase iron-sulfur subunit